MQDYTIRYCLFLVINYRFYEVFEMKSIILSIGTELLLGQILNTNEKFISERLKELGIDVLYRVTVGDNPDRLEEVVKLAVEKADLVVISGGLGPTEDDLTKETVAKAMDKKLVLNKNCLHKIKGFFRNLDMDMSENNIKQAYIPESAIIMENDEGTAPGFIIEDNNKIIAVMPGPPREMERMFKDSLIPFLSNKNSEKIYYRNLRLIGIGESDLETRLLDLISNQTDPTIATYAKEGECSVRITSKKENLDEAKKSVDSILPYVNERVGEFIFSYDDKELIEVVADKLKAEKLTISTAESCTGGLLASTFTDVPGISEVYEGGFVTYSNQAKIREIGVSEKTLKEYGAVSEQVAYQMAEGVRRVAETDIGISITGIAGPDGGSADKPVGLAYVGIAAKHETKVFKILIKPSNRTYNKRIFMLRMLRILNEKLDETNMLKQR